MSLTKRLDLTHCQANVSFFVPLSQRSSCLFRKKSV